MGILGAEIPDGLIFAIVPVALTFIISFLVWLARDQGKSAIDRAEMRRDLGDHERRIERLEK